MAGYSGRSLTEKLGLKEDDKVCLIAAPEDYRALLEPLPADLQFVDLMEEPRVIHYFCTERSALVNDLPAMRKVMRDDGTLWVSWPKKSSGVSTDVTEHVVREVAVATGLVDNKICAVDETWTAMKFVVRLIHRQTKTKAR